MDIDKIILGIDPGTNQMGYAILQILNKQPIVIRIGIIELSKFTDHYLKLQAIFRRTLEIVEQYKPDEIAIEAPFFGKNVQSMLKLGRAQGVAMAAGLYRSIPIFEYSPKKIKMSVTGNGNASKEQIAAFLEKILKIKLDVKFYDASDALATALCHYYQRQTPLSEGNSKTWKDFINQNPDRIKRI